MRRKYHKIDDYIFVFRNPGARYSGFKTEEIEVSDRGFIARGTAYDLNELSDVFYSVEIPNNSLFIKLLANEDWMDHTDTDGNLRLMENFMLI